MQSVLNGLTGLSPAHLSTRGLAVTNPKKLRQVQQHGQQWLLTFLTDKGYSGDQVKNLISGQPQTPLAALAYGIQHSAFQPLPLTVGHAQWLDAFTAGAKERLLAQDLPSYRVWLLAFLQEASDAGAEAGTSERLCKLARAIAAADDWYALRWPTDQLAQQVLLSFVAAWDVESGARYFTALVPMPTLPGFFPRIQASKNNAAPGTLAVIRPVQLLLQRLWVIAKRGTSLSKRWPDQLPGPTELAGDIALPSVSDATIRKINAGFCKLSADAVLELWTSLCESLSGGQTYPPPFMWILMALWMDTALLKPLPKTGRPGSVVILDEAAYRHIWAMHRSCWAGDLPRPGADPWPRCLLDQGLAGG